MTGEKYDKRSVAGRVILILLCAFVIIQLVFVARFFTYPNAIPAASSLNRSNGDGILVQTNSIDDAVNPDVTALWAALNPTFSSPVVPVTAEGLHDYVVNVTIINTRAEKLPFNYARIALQGSDGNLYYASSAACGRLYDDPSTVSVQYANGSVLRGETTESKLSDVSPSLVPANSTTCYAHMIQNQTVQAKTVNSLYILYTLPDGVTPRNTRVLT